MAQQLLFKYRSLESWRFLLDILVNKRLYAAPFRDLNDPMEGRYYYFGDEMTRAFKRMVNAKKDAWRICSLTTDPHNTLMWSYYSSGHTGVALGVTVLNPSSYQIRDVFYDSHVEIGPGSQRRPLGQVALEVLSRKQVSWAHEKEVRVFARQPYIPIRLKEIKLGCKASPSDRELLGALLRKTNPRVNIVQMTRDDLDAPPEAFQQAGAISPEAPTP